VVDKICIIRCIQFVDHDVQHGCHCTQCSQGLQVTIELSIPR
jgi:hypothetical protein